MELDRCKHEYNCTTASVCIAAALRLAARNVLVFSATDEELQVITDPGVYHVEWSLVAPYT